MSDTILRRGKWYLTLVSCRPLPGRRLPACFRVGAAFAASATRQPPVLRLSGATNLSPVWGLSLAQGLTAALAEPAEPMGSLVVDGVEHVVERVVDPDRIAVLGAEMGVDYLNVVACSLRGEVLFSRMTDYRHGEVAAWADAPGDDDTNPVLDDVLEAIRKDYGRAPLIFERMSERPEVLISHLLYKNSVLKTGTLDPKIVELISLAVSAALRCNHCTDYHVQAALRKGANPDEILKPL